MACLLSLERPNRTTCAAVFIAVFASAILFALYTGHTWEDFYISFRSSKNLATGHGLVFTPGQRAQTFTSPLNALLPALYLLATGHVSDELVIWLIRITGCAALGAAAVLLLKIASHAGLGRFPTLFLLGMFGLNAKIIDFSVNGMEVGYMMLFLTLALCSLSLSSRSSFTLLGIAWAGLMWTRPDAFVYIGGIAVGLWLFCPQSAGAQSRYELARVFVKGGLLTTALYGPWLLGAWFYYGTPVPLTVIAKGLSSSPITIGALLKDIMAFPVSTLVRQSSLDGLFVPPNAEFFGGWHYSIAVYGRHLAWICTFYWLLPFGRPMARAVSFALSVGNFYLSHIAAPFSWYIPSCSLLAFVVLAFVVTQSLNCLGVFQERATDGKRFSRGQRAVRIAAGAVVLVNLSLTIASAYQLRIHQSVIEDGNRKQIGLWLRAHAASSLESVFLEPPGYIGFFSQLKTYDFPGLSSPEVVEARKRLGSDSWSQLIRELRPDWLVLRPFEARSIRQQDAQLLKQDYSEVMVFNAARQIDAIRWIPGRGCLKYDQTYLVFRRHAS